MKKILDCFSSRKILHNILRIFNEFSLAKFAKLYEFSQFVMASRYVDFSFIFQLFHITFSTQFPQLMVY
jgi:hypothetical protein